jgi:hypothetical protein
LGVVVAAIIGLVAWQQKKAAEEQASAARQQAAAAMSQLAAAELQMEAMYLIADKQSSPYMSIAPAKTRDGEIITGKLAVLNNGNGIALNVELRYGDGSPGDHLKTVNGGLVIRDSFSVTIDEGRAAISGLRLTYESVMRSKYTLEFKWNSQIHEAISQKLTESKGYSKSQKLSAED